MKERRVKKWLSYILTAAMMASILLITPIDSYAAGYDYNQIYCGQTLYVGDSINYCIEVEDEDDSDDDDDDGGGSSSYIVNGDIYIVYLNASGDTITSEYDEGFVAIAEYYDPDLLKPYKSYTVTDCSIDYEDRSIAIYIKGNKPNPDPPSPGPTPAPNPTPKPAPKTYVIAASKSAGGSINNTGTVRVNEGDKMSYSIAPDNGYTIDKVLVDGNSQGAISTYTFTNVKGDHTIQAYFTQSNAYSLTVTGSYSPKNGAGTYSAGQSVAIDAGTYKGYVFAGWVGSDGIKYPAAKTNITMPSGNYTVTATWLETSKAYPVATSNLKNKQISTWDEIAKKIPNLTKKDLASAGNTLNVNASGAGCIVDATAVKNLNKNKAYNMTVFYGNDVSFTFWGSVDNSKYVQTDFTCTTSYKKSGDSNEKDVNYSSVGEFGTTINVNVKLDNGVPGKAAYVYVTASKKAQNFYYQTTIDKNGYITIPFVAKANMSIIY